MCRKILVRLQPPSPNKCLLSMKKTVITIVLAVIAIAALVWACSFKFSGLAWFPGFFVSVFCGIKILDVNGIGQNTQNNARQ